MTLQQKTIILLVSFVFCLIATYYVNIFFNLDIVYSHLFYIPILLCGLWYHKKTVYLALSLGLLHIGADYYATQSISICTFLRTGVFIFVGFLVGSISEKRDHLLAQLEKINSAMLDFVCEIDVSGNFGYISPSVINTLGYRVEELRDKTFFDLVHPDDKNQVKDIFTNASKSATALRVDYRYLNAQGSYQWLESLANPLMENGALIVYVFGSRDITYRKQIEEKLKYLSIHDAVTGLYNRRFFEEQMQLLDSGRSDPVTVISCDIDGLKIINDYFGHQYGDQAIIQVAKILQETVRSSDIVARIGGDEFAVLIPQCPESGGAQICQKIREATKRHSIKINGMDVPVLLSVGYAVRDGNVISISDLFIESDNKMYEEKISNAMKKVEVYGPLIKQETGELRYTNQPIGLTL